MSIIKMLTVFDDYDNLVLSQANLKLYTMAYLPVFFRYKSKSYLDSINTNALIFHGINKSQISSYGISSKVFQYVYDIVSDRGYRMLIAICPHGKYTPFHKEALVAQKRQLRNAMNNNITDLMPVHVVDSRAFGVAPALMAMKISDMYSTSAMNEELLKCYLDRFAKSSVTYLLTEGKNSFDNYKSLRAYRITYNRVFPLELNGSSDEENIDIFMRIIIKAIKKSKCRYAASFGMYCRFSTNFVEKLKWEYKYYPVADAPYAIPTSNVIGSNSLCIHFGDYI